MIQTKQDLKLYISADKARYKLRKFRVLGRFMNDESYYVTKFLKCLRHLEYYSNNHRSIWNKLVYIYWVLRHRYLEKSLNIIISPNIVGKGIFIPHIVGGGDYQRITHWRQSNY